MKKVCIKHSYTITEAHEQNKEYHRNSEQGKLTLNNIRKTVLFSSTFNICMVMKLAYFACISCVLVTLGIVIHDLRLQCILRVLGGKIRTQKRYPIHRYEK